MDSPFPLRSSIDTTKIQVQRDMAQLRHQNEGNGRDDLQVNKQLDYLIISMINILLNTEASGLCYRFIRVNPDERFDSERMEPVGMWTGVEEGFSEDLRVRLAMTRALMECDETGIPQTCVVKAKVVLKLG